MTRDEINRRAFDNLPEDRTLMSSNELNGCHIQATDGEIGHVDDVLVDEDSWRVCYLVLDTSNWIGGRSVVVSPRVLTGVDLSDRIVKVDADREDIRQSPLLDSIEVGPGGRRAAVRDYLTVGAIGTPAFCMISRSTAAVAGWLMMLMLRWMPSVMRSGV